MAFVTVKHARTRDDREFRLDLDFNRGSELVDIVNNNLDKYDTVARIVLGGNEYDILSDAWELTNTVDEPWYINTDITKCFEGDGCRSTSIGDIITIEGYGSYVVNGCGFKPLD